MKIDDKKIKFIFYLDGNKYVVFSLKEDIEIGDDLYFAKEVNEGIYDSVKEDEYDKVLNEYKDYLNTVWEDEIYEN